MARTDTEIASLVAERKVLPRGWVAALRPQPHDRSLRAELAVVGEHGSEFKVRVRQSAENPLDFSVILAFCPKGSSEDFNLRRYNGKSHPHGNPIEGEAIPRTFHIHEATERYQVRGSRPEHYARATKRYADVEGALRCLVEDCGFVDPESDEGPSLFSEVGGGS